jgi:hypothetical protein
MSYSATETKQVRGNWPSSGQARILYPGSSGPLFGPKMSANDPRKTAFCVLPEWRSFKNGHTDRNFAVSSARLTTRPQDSTVDQKVVPLFMSGT